MLHFIEQLKRARIAGHPIHSMLVHFPSALFPISLLFDATSIYIHDPCLPCAAFYSIAAGLVLGFFAAIAGVIDYSRLSASHPGWSTASLHAVLNIIWYTLFAIVLGLKLKHYPHLAPTTPLEITLSTIAVIGLIYSNYLGGNLIFKYQIGFEEKDNSRY